MTGGISNCDVVVAIGFAIDGEQILPMLSTNVFEVSGDVIVLALAVVNTTKFWVFPVKVLVEVIVSTS